MKVSTARRLALAVTATATVSVLTAACSSTSGSTAGSAGTSGTATSGGSGSVAAAYLKPPTSLPVTTPVTKAIPSGLKLIFIQPGYPQAQTILEGLRAAATTLGWSVASVTYDPTNPATIPSAIESAIAQKPDAIILNGALVKQYSSAIPKAIAAGVPLIPTVTPDEAQRGIYPVLDSTVENGHMATLVTDAILGDAQKSGVTAHILQLTVPAVAFVFAPQDAGVASELKAKCSSCTRSLLDIDLPDVFNGTYVQQVVSYLQRHPDINYVISDSGQLGDGLPQALQQAGLTKVKNYGMAATSVQIKQLQSGAAGAWTVQPLQVWGWIIADQVARLKVGDPTNLWANEQLSYVITSENAKGVDPADQEFPAGYQQVFKKMWSK